MDTVAIIIPSLNPDDFLYGLVQRLTELCTAPVIVINDGSSVVYEPVFSKIAGLTRVHVLTNRENLGKGAALKEAFRFALGTFPALTGVVTGDGDGQHHPEDIVECIRQLQSKPDSIILGRRNFSDHSVPWKSKVGNAVVRMLFRMFYHLRINDTQTGLRGIPAAFLPELLQLPGTRYEFETDMLIANIRKDGTLKHPFVEYPILTIYRDGNRASHFSALPDSLRVCSLFFRR